MNKEKNATGQKPISPIPEGFHTVTPFMIVAGASMLLEFIKEAFNGKTTYIIKDEDNKVMHATVKIGDSIIMLADASEKFAPAPSMLQLYVDDVDTVYEQALKAKGISLNAPTNEFYGDRTACIKDPWDNHWWIATHIEDVSEENIKERMKKHQV